jgi:hypothetical protein
MAEDEEEVGGGRISPAWKSFLASLLVDLVCLPLVLVMVFFWPVFILAIAPYIAGALGGRFTDRRTGMWAGGLAAAVMMTVLVVVFIIVMSGLEGLGEGFDPTESIGLGLVASGYAISFIFGALGGRHGAISAEETGD